MKKLLVLFLIFLPCSAFADRLGDLSSNADVLLSTQAVVVSSAATTRTLFSSRNAGATGTWVTMATVTLPSGTWSLTGQISLNTSGTIQDFLIAISSNTGTDVSSQVDGDNQIPGSPASSLGDGGGTISDYTVVLSGTVAYYLKSKVSWNISTPLLAGRISAVRR